MSVSFIITFLLWFTPAANKPVKEINVLFIGNSLTYVNDLPALVAEIGKMDNTTIRYKQIAKPDYSMEDHLNEGAVQEEIMKGTYNFVVVQQGPSAMPDSRELLIKQAYRFRELCDKANAILCLYMVWPAKARLRDLDNVIESYRLASRETGSRIAPAGLAWKFAWETNAATPLYGPDNFHPSYSGSLLAAMCIYGELSMQHQLEYLEYKKLASKENITRKEFKLLKDAAVKALHN